MTKIVPFPIDEFSKLTFDQCASVTSNRRPSSGIIIGYDEDDEIFVFNFGQVTRRDALWLSEQLKRHAMGEEIS